MMKANHAAVLLLAFLSACGQREESSRYDPPHVSVWEVKSGSNATPFDVPGTINPYHQSELQAPIAGVLHWGTVSHVGTTYGQGEIVAVIKSPELETKRQGAQDRLAFAQQRLEQQRQAQTYGLISIQELKSYEQAVAEARTELQLVELDLARASVRMPAEAEVVWRVDVAEGGEIAAGERLCRIAEMDRWKFEGYCQAVEWERIKSSTKWMMDAGDGGALVEAALDEATDDQLVPGRVRLLASFKPRPTFASGGPGKLRAEAARESAVVAVPPECIVYVNRKPHVYLVKHRSAWSNSGTIVLQPVMIGTETPESVTVLAGLSPGDFVARSNLESLAPDAGVAIEGKQP